MSDAPERTHYADDETLAHIAELEAKVAALEQERDKLKEIADDVAKDWHHEKRYREKYEAEAECLRAAIRDAADKMEVHEWADELLVALRDKGGE